MTQPIFETALAKGAIGEAVVRQVLEDNGWIVYQPATEGAHQFDMLGIKDKSAAVAFDVKAKARMNKWPCTGVNQQHFEEYKRFSERHRMPFWIVFVDEAEHAVYGNTIEHLEVPREIGGKMYPHTMITRYGKELRLWPLEAMRHIASLDDDNVAALRATSQRNYDYRFVGAA